MNILHNAIQAIKESGEIRIKTALVSDGNDNATIRIQDTGGGMSDDVRKRIFEPFYTTKEANVGTGLGLSISADIIGKHGGTIEVESTVGIGTEFIITLPVNGPANG